eukprot:ANDGO_06949.mRNA.1 hypothetical protein
MLPLSVCLRGPCVEHLQNICMLVSAVPSTTASRSVLEHPQRIPQNPFGQQVMASNFDRLEMRCEVNVSKLVESAVHIAIYASPAASLSSALSSDPKTRRESAFVNVFASRPFQVCQIPAFLAGEVSEERTSEILDSSQPAAFVLHRFPLFQLRIAPASIAGIQNFADFMKTETGLLLCAQSKGNCLSLVMIKPLHPSIDGVLDCLMQQTEFPDSSTGNEVTTIWKKQETLQSLVEGSLFVLALPCSFLTPHESAVKMQVFMEPVFENRRLSVIANSMGQWRFSEETLSFSLPFKLNIDTRWEDSLQFDIFFTVDQASLWVVLESMVLPHLHAVYVIQLPELQGKRIHNIMDFPFGYAQQSLEIHHTRRRTETFKLLRLQNVPSVRLFIPLPKSIGEEARRLTLRLVGTLLDTQQTMVSLNPHITAVGHHNCKDVPYFNGVGLAKSSLTHECI